jgi:ribosomal protein S16
MINLLNKKSKQKIIRLRIRGRKFYPIFDIVLINKCNRNRGRIVEKLGFINPNFNEKLFFINTFRLSY